jgi:GTP-binding protein Era
LNRLCGHKIAITGTVPQITRNKIRGVLSEERGQLVFIDTPGFHESEKKINVYMKDLVRSAIEESELILYLIDAGRPAGREEELLRSELQPHSDRLLIGINKADIHAEKASELKEEMKAVFPRAEACIISAREGDGTEELLNLLFTAAPRGDCMYPEEFYTDQDPEFRAAEIIREKATDLLAQELPHAIFVEIADMEENSSKETLWIRAFINVERESQKGIVIGKRGHTIKMIRTKAQKELNLIFPYRVELDLRVKVRYKWRRNDPLLKKIIL